MFACTKIFFGNLLLMVIIKQHKIFNNQLMDAEKITDKMALSVCTRNSSRAFFCNTNTKTIHL